MPSTISRSIESLEKVSLPSEKPLLLYIDKEEGCILTTSDKTLACPMYEIADWVQNLCNKCITDSPDASGTEELKRLHKAFKKLWNNYISEISLSR